MSDDKLRDALVEVLAIAESRWLRDPHDLRHEHEVFADALLAAGWRGPDASETQAWAVVGKDGEIETDTVHPNLDHVQSDLRAGQRIVRVAIRVIEGGDDGA